MEQIMYKIEQLNTKEDFVAFVVLLVQDLKEHPDEWSNQSLEHYLDAVGRWTKSMEWYYRNNKLPVPENTDWKTFAHILVAAKMYE